MAGETFSLTKFIGSFFQVLPWVKNARYIIGIVIVLFVGTTVYRAYFMPKQHTAITAQKGSTVNVYQDKNKISFPHFIPYVDAWYGKIGGRHDSLSNAEDAWEVKAGLRIEFDGIFDLFKK